MTKTKSKHMTGKAFSAEVCDAIRHHIGERKALDSKRVIAFEDRDAALSEKQDIDDHGSDEYLEACKKHSDAIAAIDTLSSQIKWHRNQVDELVEKADEPQLDFMYEPPAEPVKKDPKQLKLVDGLGEGEKPVRPVGKHGPVKPEAPDASKGDGVDEHLNASVNELDCRENIIGKLKTAGLMTIAQVAKVLDDENRNIQDRADITEAQERALRKAVGDFRAKHRQAAVEVERA